MKKKYAFIVLFIAYTCNILLAQSKQDWADSLFTSLQKDQSKTFSICDTYSDTLIYLFHKNKNTFKEIKTYLYKSYSFNQKGDFRSSLRSVYLANQLYQNKPDTSNPILAEIYLAYASLYSNFNMKARTNYFIEKGLSSWMYNWPEKSVIIRLYILKGSQEPNLETQLAYYFKAYNLAQTSNNLKSQEIVLGVLGSTFAERGDYPKAKIYLKKSLELALKRDAYSTLSSIYNNLAGIEENQKKQSIYVDSALYYSKLSGDLEDQLTATENKALSLYNQGNFKEGYDLLWDGITIKDSLYNSNKVKSFAEMEQKYESEKKNIEIELLQGESEIAKLKANRNLGISIVLISVLVALFFIAIGFYKQNKKKEKLNAELTIEKKKSDDLLLNILPTEIAEELKFNGKSAAKQYNHVTVLFTDFVNFTGISEEMSATELVNEIHTNFTAFDAIMEKHGIEKIKTIGDAYLAVGGLPLADEKHAINGVLAALEVQEFMKNSGGKFKIRIGLHSGPVVAGIVGVKKYAYDIWGDTVNTAARMEQHSEVGKINISGATYELIKDSFQCTYRGKINAKNKGEIDMYFVDQLSSK
ncbi:MAG: hypothetical protein CFE21_16765 [Bacteroidetes bacterium B1(2017)]|nr:MAG: hypothetical protein CFE21_16765 [Bacteroidetes bacterium B1(2017)]